MTLPKEAIDGFQLRSTTEHDEELLLRIYASTRAREMAMVPWTPQQKEQFLRMQSQAQEQSYHERCPNALFAIVQSGGRDVGRLYLLREAAQWRMLDFTILPEERASGLGQRVLQWLKQQAREHAVSLSIYVDSLGDDESFFASVEFQRMEQEGFHILMEWKPSISDGGAF